MKRLLLWICALALLLSCAVTAGAELTHMNDGTEKSGIYVYYIPATKDNDERLTAQYVAQTIEARWPETQVTYAKYNAKAFKPAQEVFTNGNSDGTGAINTKVMPKQPEAQACDYWFIVPQEAAVSFINNGELTDQCRTLLTNGESRIHVVLIGNHAIQIPAESALGILTAEGRTDWIQIASDFKATQLPSSSYEDRNIHTGSFFTAALFGQPTDLPVTLSEDGLTRTFTMPETGKAFILVQWAQTAGTADCTDATGNPCEKQDMTVQIAKNAAFTGTLLPKMAGGGEYSVTCSGGDIVSFGIYWYPNLTEIAPAIVQGGAWRRGKNTVELTISPDFGRPEDFVVQFDYHLNDGPEAQQSATYNEEKELWQMELVADTSTETVSVTPSARFIMQDGNKIWEWHGERVVFDVLSEGVRTSSQAPENLTIYYDPAGKAYGTKEYAWSDFFTYNPDDHPEFDCIPAEGSETLCVRFTKNEKGITLTAADGDDLAETCSFRLTATLQEEKPEHMIEIKRVSMADVYQAISIEGDPEVHVGENAQLGIRTDISSEILEQLQEAYRQRAIRFTEASLILASKSNDTEEQTVPLTTSEGGEGLHAELALSIPENAPSGSASAHAEIRITDQDTVISEKEISYTVINNPPEFTQSGQNELEIRLDGFPWAYHKIGNLLTEVFGTDKLFELFKDPETEIVSATVKVNNAQQEEILSETIHNAEDAAEVEIGEPGEYEIILTATDGVNESEPFTQRVKVYSIVMRIVSYAVAGLAAVLLILVIVLIIIHAKKPSFENIRIRAFISSDEDQNMAIEVLNKCNPVSLTNFGKKSVSLATALILCRQPELSSENMAAAEDITLLPTKHNELNIQFGKEALKVIGRSEKKETLAQGNMFRVRMGNTYIQIENVQP